MIYTTHLLHHIRRNIGHNIHIERAKQGISIHKLSVLTGIHYKRLDHYELGKNQLRFEHLVRVACALDVPMNKLL